MKIYMEHVIILPACLPACQTLSKALDILSATARVASVSDISNSPKVLRATFLGKNGLFVLLAYASLAALRTLLQQLLA